LVATILVAVLAVAVAVAPLFAAGRFVGSILGAGQQVPQHRAGRLFLTPARRRPHLVVAARVVGVGQRFGCALDPLREHAAYATCWRRFVLHGHGAFIFLDRPHSVQHGQAGEVEGAVAVVLELERLVAEG
jgi:hypothetical protein